MENAKIQETLWNSEKGREGWREREREVRESEHKMTMIN